MTETPRGISGGTGLLVARIACLLVAVAPLIAAAVAAPTVDLSPGPAPSPKVVVATPPVVEDDPEEQLEHVVRQVTDRLDDLAGRTHFAVSLVDDKTGATFDHGRGRFRTASLVKVHFSALMLWQADSAGVPITEQQRSDIEQMLVRSENDPALRAYYALGGPPAIERGLARAFGETRIEIGERSFWGSSTTRPRDVVAVLRTVLSTDREASRRYALMHDAMARVIPEQRWGVTAMADRGSRPRVKVGWVDSPTGWVVNSSGRVLVDGSPVFVSVMTDGNPSLEAGIAAIEDVVRPLDRVVRARRELAEAVSRRQAHPELCFSARPPTSAC